jgi:integrase
MPMSGAANESGVEQPVISTELVRQVKRQPPERDVDYRDPKQPGFVLRARASGVHSWRVQLPDRSWISLGLLSEVGLADAREAAQKHRAHASVGGVLAKSDASEDITFGAFLDEHYEPWMKATYRGNAGQVVRIRKAFPEFLDLSLSDITAARVDRWRATRRSHRSVKAAAKVETVAGATINRDLAALQSSLSRAVEWGRLSRNPVQKMKRSTEDASAVVRYLSDKEEQRLREALAGRDATRRAARESANAWRRERSYDVWPDYDAYTDHLTPLVLVALNTGLRRGELLRLAWRDVDLERRLLTVRGAGAKTGQTRHVPLNSEAVRVLETHAGADVDGQAFVFASGSGKDRLKDVKKAWTAVLKSAKVRGFRFHDLRHTFASKLVMGGVDLNTVRELLGHRTITMTLRYAHLAPEHKAAAVERLVRT